MPPVAETIDTAPNHHCGENDRTNIDLSQHRHPLPDDKHIRLVHVSAPDEDAEQSLPNLTFLEVQSDHAPPYKALSYTWGPPTAYTPCTPDRPSVTRSNQQECLYISPNLEACLRELVILSPGLWWIDALCINQDDDIEKSQQVKIMRSIYAGAEETVVWLGPKLDDGEMAMDLLRQLSSFHREDSIPKQNSAITFTDQGFAILGLPKKNSPAWRSLLMFLNRSYFERIWVVQELAVSRGEISVLCGNSILSWWILSAALRVVDRLRWRKPLETLAWQQNIPTLLPAIHLRQTTTILRFSKDKLDMGFLLGTCRAYLSTEPRDKIIALLGLISKEEKALKELQPNYQQPVDDLFRDVCGALVMHHRTYDLLTIVEPRSVAGNLNLPSWVPNFAVRQGQNRYHVGQYIPNPSETFNGRWKSGSSILQVQARTLDVINEVSANYCLPGTELRNLGRSWLQLVADTQSLDAWDLLLEGVDPESPKASTLDTFWRTLIGNQMRWTKEPHEATVPTAPEYYLYLFLGFLLGHLLKEDNARAVDMIDSWDSCFDLKTHLQESTNRGEHDTYSHQFMESALRNTFFLTQAGRMGLGPWTLQKGDEVAAFSGGNCLFFVRRQGQRHSFVGHGYVHGLMDGSLNDENETFQTIDLL
ncbi:MAG: hypothetical protein Q9169_007804 [Polycauliona sp. 2 TL-2023]